MKKLFVLLCLVSVLTSCSNEFKIIADNKPLQDLREINREARETARDSLKTLKCW